MTALRYSQYYLGLLSGFQRATCISYRAASCSAAPSTSSTAGSATSFLLPGLFFSALLPTLFPGRRRQLLHLLPEVRQGLVLVRSGEPVEERPCIPKPIYRLWSFFLSLVSEATSRS